jgi:alkylation response protein AidB-like acyl-CoA dehydrogenase
LSLSALVNRLREILLDPLPLPGSGQTAKRHVLLMQAGREDLSLARLAEAHWDAVAILAEAGREALPGAIYGVWASEIPGKALALSQTSGGWCVSGSKMFCSGAGIVDRALVTVGSPIPQLIDVDLFGHDPKFVFDDSAWKTMAFAETKTATCTFNAFPVSDTEFIGEPGWYLNRPGFWHGACGPAACWAGGAAGLLDYALQQSRNDAHTMAHLGAMSADIWAMRAYLMQAGEEIDASPRYVAAARIRARTVRHLVEQACTDTLRRLARAYGPHPLAMQTGVSRRYQELDLYVRQSHAERDLEALGFDLYCKI